MPSTQHMVPLRSVANKKLLSEAESLSRNPVKGCEAAPRDDDVMIWTAVIEGPTGSLYEGGSFFVQLRFDDDYPFTAPNVIFLTRIYHCNIDNEGRINLPLINTGWSPCKSISDILRAILALMRQCQPEMALEQELGDQMFGGAGEIRINRKRMDAKICTLIINFY
ncbi:UBC core domain-containing protein [Aphelenchoides bicaudatus]|nr:UBC core domain-containing protein [Aphelenchoides bicaudatus]